MKIFISALVVFLLVGCATEPVPPNKAKYAPPDRVFAYQTAVDNGAILTVVRDKGFLGSGCYSGLYVNQKRIASLNPGEKVDVHLPAGEWLVGFKGEGAVCLADDFLNEREISLKPKQHKAVRLFAAPSGNLDIKSLSI